ncbi:MAG: hypothetical protein ACKOWE_02245 [Micrococcales bacterium]
MKSNFETFGVDQVIELNHGDWHSMVSPQGASLKTLSYKNEPLVVVPLPVTDFAFVGSALAPWANRLEDATWELDGKKFYGEITEPSNNNGLHGLVVARDFDVVAQAEASVTFRYTFGADAVYPFKVIFEVTYTLTDAGLRVTMAATNRDSRDLPISFGSHPYFLVDEDSEVKVSAAKATLNSSRRLPIGEQSVHAIGLAHNEFVPVFKMQLDDRLFELGHNGRTVLSRPALGRNIVVWQDPEFAYQMMFVRGPRFAGSNPVTLAIEPQTSPANALASNVDAVWLTVGETRAFSWGVSVE